MGELTIFEGGNIPSFLKGQKDDLTTSLAGGGSRYRRISIKGGVFRQIINGKEVNILEERSMDILIVNAAKHVSRNYYEGAFVEGENAGPVCWSTDGERPDAGVKEKQANICAKCPQNIKGSGNNESRACRYQQRLAVLVDGEIEKEEIYQLTLPATSIFGDVENNKMPLQAYARFLSEQGESGVPIWGVITTMRFDPKSTAPKLVFRPRRVITEDEYEIIQRLKDSKEAIEAISLTVSQVDAADKKPTELEAEDPKPAVKKAAPKPAPVIEDDEEEETPRAAKKPAPIEDEEDDIAPPKKAESKKATPVASEPKLEDLLGDDWDD